MCPRSRSLPVYASHLLHSAIVLLCLLLAVSCGSERGVDADIPAGDQPNPVTHIGSVVTPTPVAHPVSNTDPTTRWLLGVPCRAPCWEGVTPGKTIAEEAVTIFRQSPILKNVQISAFDDLNLGYI